MKYLALAALLVATPALADERFHRTPAPPIECKGVSPPSGYCVRGPTYYRLDGSIIKWIVDKTDPIENPDFWNDQTKWGGGANETSVGSASK